MKVVAAYLLALLGGNESPSAKDLKHILGSGLSFSHFACCFFFFFLVCFGCGFPVFREQARVCVSLLGKLEKIGRRFAIFLTLSIHRFSTMASS
jgi:hypothetical protein